MSPALISFVVASIVYFSARLLGAWLSFPVQSMVFILITSILATTVAIAGYLRYELKRQKTRHEARRAEYAATEKVKALDANQYAVFIRKVIKKLELADRKRLIFEVTKNTLLLFAGLFPMVSTMVDDAATQRLLSFLASFSAFILGLFGIQQFAVEHRRAGFLIEKAIDAWLVGNDSFSGLDSEACFRELIYQVQLILDTTETSFVGAGGSNGVTEEDVATVAELFPDDDNLQEVDIAPTTEKQTAKTQEAPPSNDSPLSQSMELFGGSDTDILQMTGEAIAPDDFPAWQAKALAAQGTDDEDDMITQG